jgi:hypothetical protein
VNHRHTHRLTVLVHVPPNKALQLPGDSAFQSTRGKVWHRNLGASAHPVSAPAAESPVR